MWTLDVYLHKCDVACVKIAHFIDTLYSVQSILLVYMSVHLVLLCACLKFYICLTVSSCWSWCRSIKLSSSTERWNEDRKSNQCSKCLRACRFPFHFPHSGKTKNDTQVNEQTAEVVWGNATVHFRLQPVTYADHRRFLIFIERVSDVCACTACLCVCVSELQREWPGECWILSMCDRERDNAANRCQAKLPPCRATVLFIASLLKKAKIFLSLPRRLSLRSHCILWSVLLFKCSYSPFRRRATFKPTVTMATPICIWKSAFEGANKMCNNMPWHCASLTKYSKYGHMRNIRWVVWGGGGFGGGGCKCLIDVFCFYCLICLIYIGLIPLPKKHIHKNKKPNKKKDHDATMGYETKIHFPTHLLHSQCFLTVCITLHMCEELTVVLKDFIKLFVGTLKCLYFL